MRHDRHSAIGVFDSGIGGLTVLRALQERLPQESTVYLGDTARVPYGTKSADVVTKYSVKNAEALLEYGVKLLVVACNTASSVAIPTLRKQLPIPVVGVIEPGDEGIDHFQIVAGAGDDDAIRARIDGDAQINERGTFGILRSQGQR